MKAERQALRDLLVAKARNDYFEAVERKLQGVPKLCSDWTLEGQTVVYVKPPVEIDPFTIPPGEPCKNCGKREAKAIWADDGITASGRGGVAWWCELCVLRAQLAHAEERAGQIVHLREAIEALLRREFNC